MAKKKAAKSKSSTRDASPIASSAALETGIRPEFQRAVDLYYGIDRRTFRPDESTRPPSANRPFQIVSRLVQVKNIPRQVHGRVNRYNPFYQARSHLRQRLGFSLPRRIEACIRRQARKEVLHAKRKTGKAGQRKPSRNFWSAISCR